MGDDRSIAEIIGWTSDRPTIADMLAWLIGREATVRMFDDSSSTELLWAVMVDFPATETHVDAHAPTLHAALEAAVRDVGDREDHAS